MKIETVTALAAAVGGTLAEKGMTIAVAESCTGGLIANLITDIPGSSRYFERGVVSYSDRSKEELLGVSARTLTEHGAVSREVAIEMAEGMRGRSGASMALGVTGIAGPGGGTAEKPVGTVHIALASEEGTEMQSHLLPRDRASFKLLVAWTALDMIRRHLKNRRT